MKKQGRTVRIRRAILHKHSGIPEGKNKNIPGSSRKKRHILNRRKRKHPTANPKHKKNNKRNIRAAGKENNKHGNKQIKNKF